MPTSMQAARLHAFGQPLVVESVPIPAPGPGQILVRVRACGVCHTDLHACRGDWRARPPLPCISGHEVVGDVTQIGPGVTDLKTGDRVGVFWLHHACGTCEYCRSGWENLCPEQVNTGFGVPGGLAAFVVVDAAFAVPVPRTLEPADAAPLLCAGVSAFKGVSEAELSPGQTLAVIGCGGVGHLAIAYAKAAGLRVVAIDVNEAALSLAREMGADDALLAEDAGRSKKVHATLVAADRPEAIRLGAQMLRRKGTAILLGLPPGDAGIPIFDVVVKRLTLRGSIGGTRQDVRDAIDVAARNGIRPRVQVRTLDEINSVFDEMAAGRFVGRCVIV